MDVTLIFDSYSLGGTLIEFDPQIRKILMWTF